MIRFEQDKQDKRTRKREGKQSAALTRLVLLGALLCTGNVYAGPENLLLSLDRGLYFETSLGDVDIKKDYALGIHRHDLDDHTEVLGWQLSDSVYFGRQDGIDSGLTLVWQQKANQFSLSKEGLRLTRRF